MTDDDFITFLKDELFPRRPRELGAVRDCLPQEDALPPRHRRVGGLVALLCEGRGRFRREQQQEQLDMGPLV